MGQRVRQKSRRNQRKLMRMGKGTVNRKARGWSLTKVELESQLVRLASICRALRYADEDVTLSARSLVADEVDPSLIIEGPRRKRKAAEKAEQSSEWSNLLAGKLSALGDSDSDSD